MYNRSIHTSPVKVNKKWVSITALFYKEFGLLYSSSEIKGFSRSRVVSLLIFKCN